MNKIELLKKINVGERVAEQETKGLNTYFLETYLWEQVLDNSIDIVFGNKGSGKSAIYNHLSNYSYDLMGANIILALAENPRGAIAFKDLNTTPPTEEAEFKNIWRLYFVMIISQKLQEFNYKDKYINIVIEKLQESNLLPRRYGFTAMLKMVRDYIKIKSIEPNISLNDTTGGITGAGLKITLGEPNVGLIDKGFVSIDYLLECLNNSLTENGDKIWVAIDRLDAVFQENFQLEANALKTLFQVYIDFMKFDNIRLLIFFRDDIWNRIIDSGFRESSHITRKEKINWDENSLFHLIMSRFIKNKELLEYFDIDKINLESKEQKIELFYKIFPKKINSNSIFSFRWIISRIEDANHNTSPRELIHLINTAIKKEIKTLSEENKDESEYLISEISLLKALKEVSKTKLDTILAEYPNLQRFIYRLKKKKIRSKSEDLKIYWECSKKEVKIIAGNLVKIGIIRNENEFNEEKEPLYYIPMLYRPALGYSVV
ncbi:MAG: hypothetical protein GXO79_06270 [Chlorobi bacterium]|nr:hypothetical protein [Chlorobiota bacterium]